METDQSMNNLINERMSEWMWMNKGINKWVKNGMNGITKEWKVDEWLY